MMNIGCMSSPTAWEGHQAGEVASALVVETMRDYMKRFTENSRCRRTGMISTKPFPKMPTGSCRAFTWRTWGSTRYPSTKETYRGMGSTVSAIYLSDETLIAANVGDSPIYLIHQGNIERISVLHTVVAEQQALDPEGAKNLR